MSAMCQSQPIAEISSYASMACDYGMPDPMNVSIASNYGRNICKDPKKHPRKETINELNDCKIRRECCDIIPETCQFPAIVWAVLNAANRAQRILQIRIHLHFLREFGRFDFNKCRWDSLHVWPIRIESHTARTNRIFVFIGVDSYIFGSNDTLNSMIRGE